MEREWTPREADEETTCACGTKHAAAMDRARQEMPLLETLYDLADLFKLFGDTTRVRILWVLSKGELCVCDIAQLLEMGQSAISHQLRILRQSRLVKCRREGKNAIYSLDDDHVQRIIDLGLAHIEE